MKRSFLIVLLSFLLLAPEAFAQRTGGRFGGRGSFTTPRSGSTVNSPGGYGGGGFFFFPVFGVGGGSIVGGLLLLGILYFVVLRPILAARRNEDDRDYDDTPRTKPGVYTMDVAVSSTAAKDLQKRLEELGVGVDTQEGLARALRETALALLRRKDEIEGANVTVKEKISVTEAERAFETGVTKARSRYQVDVYSSEQGKVRRSEAPADTGKEGILEFLVLSFVVGTTQPLSLPAKITDRKTLDEALQALSSVPASQLAALEVVWTPGDPNDSLTRDELMFAFPELTPL
jgi:uncharacterized membrane protein